MNRAAVILLVCLALTAATARAAAPFLEVSRTVANPGSETVVEVRLGRGTFAVAALVFALSFDHHRLVPQIEEITTVDQFRVEARRISDGIIRIVIYDPTPPAGGLPDGTIMRLPFVVDGASEGFAEIRVEGAVDASDREGRRRAFDSLSVAGGVLIER